MPPGVTCHHHEAGFCAAAFRSASAAPQQNGGQQKFTFRYVQRADGARQIHRFLIPGDLFSSLSIFEDAPHFSAKALTDVQICGFPRSEMRERCFADPSFQAVVAESCVTDGRDAAKLIAVLGRSSAEQRIAYLFLHLTERIMARHVIRDRSLSSSASTPAHRGCGRIDDSSCQSRARCFSRVRHPRVVGRCARGPRSPGAGRNWFAVGRPLAVV